MEIKYGGLDWAIENGRYRMEIATMEHTFLLFIEPTSIASKVDRTVWDQTFNTIRWR